MGEPIQVSLISGLTTFSRWIYGILFSTAALLDAVIRKEGDTAKHPYHASTGLRTKIDPLRKTSPKRKNTCRYYAASCSSVCPIVTKGIIHLRLVSIISLSIDTTHDSYRKRNIILYYITFQLS